MSGWSPCPKESGRTGQDWAASLEQGKAIRIGGAEDDVKVRAESADCNQKGSAAKEYLCHSSQLPDFRSVYWVRHEENRGTPRHPDRHPGYRDKCYY